MDAGRRPGAAVAVLVVGVVAVLGVYAWSPVEGLWIGLLPLTVLWSINVLLGGGLNEPLLHAFDRLQQWWRSRRGRQSGSDMRAAEVISAATEMLHRGLTDPSASHAFRDRSILEMEAALEHSVPLLAVIGPGRGMLDLAYRNRYGRLGRRDDLDKAVINARERVRCVDHHPAAVDGRKRASSRIRYAEWLLTRADRTPNAADLEAAAAAANIARKVGNEQQQATAQRLYEEAVAKRAFWDA